VQLQQLLRAQEDLEQQLQSQISAAMQSGASSVSILEAIVYQLQEANRHLQIDLVDALHQLEAKHARSQELYNEARALKKVVD
jgi:flagellar biosynthesis chaperone FliJ